MNLYESILITGANGMLARDMARALAKQGRRFEAITRRQWDLDDPPQIEAMFEDLHPTLVLNCAAYTKVDLCEKEWDQCQSTNGLAVQTLADCCKQYGSMLVHFSTDFVFDGTLRRPYRPNDETRPLSAYGRSKLLGEQLLKANAPSRWLIIRTAWLYGPIGACFPQTILNAARAGKPLRVVDDQTGTPTYTRDLADATLSLIDSNASGLFHITNSGQTTWYDFTRAILDEFQIQADLHPISSADWQKLRPQSAIRPAYSVLDCSDFTRVTRRTIRPWQDALADYRNALEHPDPKASGQ